MYSYKPIKVYNIFPIKMSSFLALFVVSYLGKIRNGLRLEQTPAGKRGFFSVTAFVTHLKDDFTLLERKENKLRRLRSWMWLFVIT